ncbi:MAG: hypothetical protein KME26_07915 [Oscillatoria princeps RMCB-10]|nr:hypothetical protein [Oscillatoria princeps RMCB-10]
MSGCINFPQLQGRASRICGMNPTPTYAPYPLTRRVRSLSHRHRWRCVPWRGNAPYPYSPTAHGALEPPAHLTRLLGVCSAV